MKTTTLMDWPLHSLGRILSRTVSKYLQNAEHRREFEEWYQKKYGKEYQWENVGEARSDTVSHIKTNF